MLNNRGMADGQEGEVLTHLVPAKDASRALWARAGLS